jgi:cystathionine beta-lyase
MPEFDFSYDVDRRGTNAIKWTMFGDDVLPMWVADTEFGAPPAVMEAVRQRLEHPVFGYQADMPALRETLAGRLAARYGWQVDPVWILPMPGLVAGLNIVTHTIGVAGDGVLMTPPIYPPFMHASTNFGLEIQHAELTAHGDGHIVRYELDFDALERAVTPRSKLLLLCNPHNPTGRVMSEDELTRLAAFAERHNLIVCSDEIHAELTYTGNQHIPLAKIAPELASRIITLYAPSKTFNIPGLGSAAAIVPDEVLRNKLRMTGFHFGMIPNALGFVAAEAAYRAGDDWLAALMTHLEGNRDFVVDYVAAHMPGVAVTRPEATYLAWMDFRAVALDDPFKFFLKEAKVALTNGAECGPGGAGFARLNFGCSRAMLTQALEQMSAALGYREKVG